MTHNFKRFPELTNNQMQVYYFDSPHKQITENFRAKVIKVTDGDTIRVECDFRDFNFPIRFSNIAAPELNEIGGAKSQNWLESKILGKEVDVLINPGIRVEKWGRLLGEIMHLGTNINEESMANGMSVKFGEQSASSIPNFKSLMEVI